MRIQKPCSTSEVVAYSSGAIDSLWNCNQVTGSYSIAGVAKDGSYGWLAKGGVLEVFNVKFGQRLAAWSFGAAIKDPDTLITAVCEFENDRTATSQLVVASTTLNSRVPGGLICLFDVHRSAVIKSVNVPYEVTTLETVAAVSPGAPLSLLLFEQVHSFCGTVAVGTQCGHLYVLDMCTDESSISTELTPKQVEVIDCSHTDVVTIRYQAITKNKHLCLELAGFTDDDELFTYTTSNGSAQCQLKSSDVYVSCLKFIKHTLTLLVGYSFGGFQMWNLRAPLMQYSSRWDADLPAVTHFAFQEPENDPKDYCYIWVVHGPTATDPVKDTSSHMTLYQLCYERKKWIGDFGFYYENLCSLAVRFNHELHFDPYNSNSDPLCGSRVIACYTLENHQFKPIAVNANETLPDEEICPDRSLCLTVWETVSHDENVASRCFLAIFDINRWYHAQLPSSISIYRNQKVFCPYWSVCTLDEVIQNTSPDALLMVHVDYSSLNRFLSPFFPLSEKFLYPSALAFNAYCISENGIVCSKFLGIQRVILGYIQKRGFSILLDPSEIYLACLKSGLLNSESPAGNPSVAYKRESLMSMALDYNAIGFIVACIGQLASAEFVAEGFTLHSFLDWAWRKLSDCKESIDQLCVPLFDWSTARLNEHNVKAMHYYQVLMRHLVMVFEALNAQSSATTDQGKEELATRLSIVRLIAEYLDAVIWFHAVGLLPEHSEEEMLKEDQFAFPSKAITAAYVGRRQNIQKLSSNASSSGVLLIDGLLEVDGTSVSQHFERECGTRLYPPTSFHAAIGIFLLPDVAAQTKLTLVLYLLKDLTFMVDFERKKKMEDICKQFCNSFNIAPRLSRHIYGIWLLDHQHFQQAAAVLLDAGACDDVPPWQHGSIIRAFLCQGQERLALKYMKVKTVPALTADDVKLRMTVLLANGLTAEALDYQRIHRDCNVIGDLMSHMILACIETNTVGELLNLPLTNEEENHLVKYLQNSDDVSGKKLVVLYYLQQSRLIDAINTNGQQKLGSKQGERGKLLEAVVEGYRKILPSVQRKMTFSMETGHRISSIHKEYARPVPLSSALHRNQGEQVVTRATLLNTVLDKVHELNIVGARSADVQPGSLEEHQPCFEETSILFNTPIVPSSAKKSRVSTCGDVIFPSSNVKDQTNLKFLNLLDSPMSFTNPVTKRLYSAAALSLLQTPPVTRRRTFFAADVTPLPNPPQSILSVRHQKTNMETSLRPSDVAGVLTFDETIGSTPVVLSSLRRGIASRQGADTTATPKLKTLRFMEPHDSPVTPFRAPTVTSFTAPTVTPFTAPTVTPFTAPTVTPFTAPTVTPVTAPTVTPVTAPAEQSISVNQQGVQSPLNPVDSPQDDSAESGDAGYVDAPMDVDNEVVFNWRARIHTGDKDETVKQSSTQLSSQPFVEPSMLATEPKVIHKDDASPSIRETKNDEMDVDEVAHDLNSSLYSDSLHRPPLWESSPWPQSADLRVSSIPGTKEKSQKRESEIPPICTDIGLQTSISRDSEDEMVLEKGLPGEGQSTTSSLPSTPTRRSTRLQTKKYDDANDVGSTDKSISEKMHASPSASVPLSRTSESNEPSSHVVASMIEPDVSNDQGTSTRRRSLRSPGREVSKPAAESSSQSEMKDNLVERPGTPTRRRSVRSPGRYVSEPAAEESAQSEMKDVVMIEPPKTLTRRRSVCSPGREVTEQPVSEDNAVELLGTPTRRRSGRSPSREVIEPVAEVSIQNEEKEVIVDDPSMSTRMRSLRSPSREVLEPLAEVSIQNEEKEVIVDDPSMSTRRRSLRSPGREVLEPLAEETAQREGRENTVEKEGISTRRSLRSPSRRSDVTEPSGEDSAPMESTSAPVEQPRMATRRRSFHSPSREVTERTVEDSANTKSVRVTPARRRSVCSPSREVIEPLGEESVQNEQNKEVVVDRPGMSTRRRSLGSPSRDIAQPAPTESEEAEKSSTRARRRSLRSPGREVTEPSVEEFGATVEQPVMSTRKRSIRSPSREVAETSVAEKMLTGNSESDDVKTVHSGTPRARSSASPSREIHLTFVLDDDSPPAENTDQPVEEQQAATPTRRRFVRSQSRERVVFMDKIDESMTPVRRSMRQKEKLDKAEGKDLGDVSVIEKSPQTGKGRKTSSEQVHTEAETGKLQTPRISKTIVLSLQEKRKPVTRSEARKARERELLELDGKAADDVSLAITVQPKPRSPGRPAKRRAMEVEETQMDVVVSGDGLPSVASIAVTMDDAAATKSNEATEKPAGPQFVFSPPVFLGDNKDAPMDVEDRVPHHSTFVFSPPHTRLRDRSAVEQRDVIPSATSSEPVLPETENADEEKVIKPGRRVKPTKRVKKSRLAEAPSNEDMPILLSPISDSEPSPTSSTTNIKKRVQKSSHVTRSKKKKFGPSDPPIFW